VKQEEAVKVTRSYFLSRWSEDKNAVPRFLWNAKMRFGKTFTTYQLAKKLGSKTGTRCDVQACRRRCLADRPRKPCRFRRLAIPLAPLRPRSTEIDAKKPWFTSAHSKILWGAIKTGNIKPKNEWLHTVNWDLVVFDEIPLRRLAGYCQGTVLRRRGSSEGKRSEARIRSRT